MRAVLKSLKSTASVRFEAAWKTSALCEKSGINVALIATLARFCYLRLEACSFLGFKMMYSFLPRRPADPVHPGLGDHLC
jgi:hypothetical protein